MIFLFIFPNYFEYIAIHWEYWAAYIGYLFGEEQSDGEYLFCIVYVLMMAV